MQIIDFERKGNVVRFYLGEKTEDWGWTNSNYKINGQTPSWLKPSDAYLGDDWDDAPYDCNAGSVYEEFIKGRRDITFAFDDLVFEPCDGEYNCKWSKDDMVNRKIPCIVVVPKSVRDECGIEYEWELNSFKDALGLKGAIKIYFGDKMEGDII